MTLNTLKWWIVAGITLVSAALIWNKLPISDVPSNQNKEYTIGVLADYKPFSYIDSQGHRVGFDYELTRRLCHYLKIQCKIQALPFQELIRASENKQIDIVVAGLWATKERQKIFVFSDSYYHSRSIFITKDPNIYDIDQNNAKDLTIGVLSATVNAASINQTLAPYGAKIIEFPKHENMIKALNNGQINTMLMYGLTGYTFLKSPEGANLFIAGWYHELPERFTKSKIAVRSEHQDLIPLINEFLLHIKATGEYQELSLKYFPFLIY